MRWRNVGVIAVALPVLVGCERGEASTSRLSFSAKPDVQKIVAKCVGTGFPHLVEVAMTGANDPTYARQAEEQARACRTAAEELKRASAPASCVQLTHGVEILLWQVAGVLSGKNDPDSLLTGPDVDGPEACARDAHFPMTPEGDRQADAAAKAAADDAKSEAEAARAEAEAAQEEALAAMRRAK